MKPPRVKNVAVTALAMLLAAALPALARVFSARGLLSLAENVWGLTARNAAFAPAWARFVAAESLGIAAAVGACAYLLPACLTGRFPKAGKGFPRAFCIGALAALLTGGLLLLLDFSRAGRGAPVVSTGVFLSLGTAAFTVFCEEAFFRGFLAGRFEKPWLSALVTSALFAFLTMPLSPAALVNGLLEGLICWALARETGGFLAGAGFRFGLKGVFYALLGFPGFYGAGLYESFPRAQTLLTGGASGPEAGFLLTLILGIGVCLFNRNLLRGGIVETKSSCDKKER